MIYQEDVQSFEMRPQSAPVAAGDKQGNKSTTDRCTGRLMNCISSKKPMTNASEARSTDNWSKREHCGLRTVLVKRDISMLKVLVLTTGSYLLLVAPMTVLNIVDKCEQYPIGRHIVYAIYAWLYCVNFFVYVSTHPLYKQAYVRLMRSVCYRPMIVCKAVTTRVHGECNSA